MNRLLYSKFSMFLTIWCFSFSANAVCNCPYGYAVITESGFLYKNDPKKKSYCEKAEVSSCPSFRSMSFSAYLQINKGEDKCYFSLGGGEGIDVYGTIPEEFSQSSDVYNARPNALANGWKLVILPNQDKWIHIKSCN